VTSMIIEGDPAGRFVTGSWRTAKGPTVFESRFFGRRNSPRSPSPPPLLRNNNRRDSRIPGSVERNSTLILSRSSAVKGRLQTACLSLNWWRGRPRPQRRPPAAVRHKIQKDVGVDADAAGRRPTPRVQSGEWHQIETLPQLPWRSAAPAARNCAGVRAGRVRRGR
jgi:hypothetical protein